MQSKKIVGLIVLIIGAVFVIYSIHLMQKTHEAKQNISVVASNEPLGAIVGDSLSKKTAENDRYQAYLLIGGMVVLLSGGGIVLLFRNRT